MIDVKELRIGNFVKAPGCDKLRVDEIYKDDIGRYCIQFDIGCNGRIYGDINDVYPIPITEELLLKCGFEKGYDKGDETDGVFNRSGFYVMYGKTVLHYQLENDKLYVMLYEWKYIQIEYLHQLQNIYYTLTGEELEVEL